MVVSTRKIARTFRKEGDARAFIKEHEKQLTPLSFYELKKARVRTGIGPRTRAVYEVWIRKETK